MSFGYLPTPVYIIMALSFSIILFVYAIKIYKTGTKILSIACILYALSGLCIGLVKSVEVYFKDYEQYIGTLIIVTNIILFSGVIIMFIVAWEKTKLDLEKRRALTISLISIIVGVLMIVAVIMLKTNAFG